MFDLGDFTLDLHDIHLFPHSKIVGSYMCNLVCLRICSIANIDKIFVGYFSK